MGTAKHLDDKDPLGSCRNATEADPKHRARMPTKGRGQLEKVRDSLPEDVRNLWPEDLLGEAFGPTSGRTAGGGAVQDG